MNELDVLEQFLDEIETVTGLNASTSNSIEDYNGEGVTIDNWSSDPVKEATDPYVGIATDETGTAIGELEQRYYEMRIDIKNFSESKQRSIEHHNTIRNHFEDYESSPKDFHEDVQLFEVGRGGPKDPYTETTSLNLHNMVRSFHIKFHNTKVVESADELQNVDHNDITVNGETTNF